ncbi:phosphatase PAP2 family protein [Demequina iriomotensis]|uniref:phosphatase PAP2 family protein n=1 Tax=Demequina iriomotensis TaxID=1536641 RepID=UPI00078473FA|nr:phosphatase PAP2 family protein [Demequina iriomotensis]
MTTPTRPRLALLLGAGGLGLFALVVAAMAATVPAAFSQGVDDAWRALVGASDVADVQGPLPMFFQHFGEGPGFLVHLVLVPVALLVVRRWRSALFWLAVMMGANILVSQVVKHLVDRERPAADEAAGLYGPLFHTDHGSFPSGHSVTMGAFVVAVAALLPLAYRRWWWGVAALLSVGMIWQRTLVNAHWLTDTVAGVLGGAAFAALVWWAFARLLDRDRGRPVRRRAADATVAPQEVTA